MIIAEFLIWVTLISLAAAFALSVATKWGVLEWLQVHAPNEFFNKLLNCNFCCSFWIGLILSGVLAIVTGHWYILLCPICSTILTRDLL